MERGAWDLVGRKLYLFLSIAWASLAAQWQSHLPMQEMQVWSLGWEDPLEKEMATPPGFLPGKSHGQRSLVGYSPWGHKVWDTIEWLTFSLVALIESCWAGIVKTLFPFLEKIHVLYADSASRKNFFSSFSVLFLSSPSGKSYFILMAYLWWPHLKQAWDNALLFKIIN